MPLSPDVDPPVLIVGAGPVGMATALLLAQAGVRSVLLERRATASCAQSRAITIQRDILAFYDRLGIAERVLADGIGWSLGRTYFHDEEILQLRFPSHGEEVYPPFVNYPQYLIEELLYAKVVSTGLAEVRHGFTAVDIAQDEHGVTVRGDGPGGREEYRGRYLVAADGLGSRIRKQLGISYDGWATQGRFLVVDFRAELPFAYERRLWFGPSFYPDGIVLMHGLDRTSWRIDWQIPVDLDADAVLASGELEARVRDVVGDRPVEILRANTYTFQQRRAERFRDGRVFLAGDAAHVVSPFGARGMNSGMEDADNLAWKLAYVLTGRAPETLLDSYAVERMAAAEHHVRITGESMRFMTPGDRAGVARRDAVLAAAAADPGKAHLVDSGKLYQPFPYRDSPLTATLLADATRAAPGDPAGGAAGDPAAPGEPAPDGHCLDPDGKATTLRAVMAGAVTALLVPGADTNLPAIAAAFGDELPVLVLVAAGDTPGANRIVDSTGLLLPLYAGDHDRLYLIRPDCYIAVRADLPPGSAPADLARRAYAIAVGSEMEDA